MKTLSKNLLKKYGLDKKKEDEGGEVSEEVEGGSGAKPKEKGTGRKAMTEQRKDMIKGGSIIALGCQGPL